MGVAGWWGVGPVGVADWWEVGLVGIVELWVMTDPFKTVLSHISTPTRKTCNSHIMHNIGNVDKKNNMQPLFCSCYF